MERAARWRSHLEDFYLAEERMKGFREGQAIPLEALKAELGLAD